MRVRLSNIKSRMLTSRSNALKLSYRATSGDTFVFRTSRQSQDINIVIPPNVAETAFYIVNFPDFGDWLSQQVYPSETQLDYKWLMSQVFQYNQQKL